MGMDNAFLYLITAPQIKTFADLRGKAVERVSKFSECFPPLDVRSNPATDGTSTKCS